MTDATTRRQQYQQRKSTGQELTVRGFVTAAAIGLGAGIGHHHRVPGNLPGSPALTGFLSCWRSIRTRSSLSEHSDVYSLAYGLGGALLGIIVGCLPGLSATLCIALLTTLTIKMAPNDAILILICSYVGTLYGGSRTAILLIFRVPQQRCVLR